jgi:hypothetical protein
VAGYECDRGRKEARLCDGLNPDRIAGNTCLSGHRCFTGLSCHTIVAGGQYFSLLHAFSYNAGGS